MTSSDSGKRKASHKSDTTIQVLDILKRQLVDPDVALEAISSRNHRIKELKNEIQHTRLVFEETYNKLESIIKEKEELEFKNTQLEAIVTDFKNKFDSKVSTYDELARKRGEISGQYKTLKNESDTLKKELETANTTIKELTENNSKLKDYFNQLENELLVIKTKTELEEKQSKLTLERITNLISWFPAPIQKTILVLLFPPFSYYFIIFLFGLTTLASFIGWPSIINTIIDYIPFLKG